MNFGIPSKSMEMIINSLIMHKEIEKASIFGSRSMGNYRNGSDIDIAILILFHIKILKSHGIKSVAFVMC